MENKENNMNILNTNSSVEVSEDLDTDLDTFLMSLISHLYDAYSSYSSSDSDSDTVSVSVTDSTSDCDLESDDSCSSFELTSDSSGKEMTINQFLDQGSDSGSDFPNSVLREKSASTDSGTDFPNSVLREKSASTEFLDPRIILQIFYQNLNFLK